MASDTTEPDDITTDVVPELAPPPTVVRNFIAAPWHRPRKQYLRKYQWNYELVELVIKKRLAGTNDQTLRVFGLPSHEYLDLLSMRPLCEEHKLQVVYLGFNNSYTRPAGAAHGPAQPVDLYQELQAQRMIEASSFVHTSSRLVPDFFEAIRQPNSMSLNALKTFQDFDVINLDLCGCVVGAGNEATHTLEAIAELLRRQCTKRVVPWLFFVTTFASPTEINLSGCKPLIDAIKANADGSADFENDLKAKINLDAAQLLASFTTPGAATPQANDFISVFALAMGKWLAAQLKVANPPSFVSMLPSYCFRHEGITDPQLLSLAYLIEPKPSADGIGVAIAPAVPPDHTKAYIDRSRKLLTKSFQLKDLDALMTSDTAKRKEVAVETEALLIDIGFDETQVRTFIAQHA